MVMSAKKGCISVDKKRISISSKRQITIPQKYFEILGFEGEAECMIRGNELVVRPIRENSVGEFAEYILEDLIKQGFQGEELLSQFKIAQKKIRPAIENILQEADQVAEGKGEYLSYKDVFGVVEK